MSNWTHVAGIIRVDSIRVDDDIENPFVTLELRDKRVIQCRAKYNTRPSDEVICFVNNWCSMNNFITCF